MDKIKKLADSVTTDDFIQGLLYATRSDELGDVWEKCVECSRCYFSKQCKELGEEMEARGQNPACGQIVEILLGELDPDDKSIQKLPNYPN